MVVPGWKRLFFLRKRRETQEEFGQKCEVVDRKGQILTILVLHLRLPGESSSHTSGNWLHSLVRRFSVFVFPLFEPLLQVTGRYIASPQPESQSEG
jgi:hypothetical protein